MRELNECENGIQQYLDETRPAFELIKQKLGVPHKLSGNHIKANIVSMLFVGLLFMYTYYFLINE